MHRAFRNRARAHSSDAITRPAHLQPSALRRIARLGIDATTGLADHVLDEDWQGRDRFARAGDPRRILPLPARVHCHAIAAVTAQASSASLGCLPGDGLVPLASALGQHADVRRTLRFAPHRQWIGRGMNHLDLLDRHEVSEQLVHWFGTSLRKRRSISP